MSDHDTYVYQGPADDSGSRARAWFWLCSCGGKAGPFPRRMDADEASGDHAFPRKSAEPDEGAVDDD